MEENIRFASGHQGGVLARYELDLTAKDFPLAIVSPDLLPFSRYEVWIRTEGATGITGNATIAAGPTKGVPDHIEALGTIALSASGTGRLAGAMDTSYISVTFGTLPAVGKITVYITAKDS